MDHGLRNAIVYGIFVSWTVFPLVCVLIVSAASVIIGCTVNEGSPTPCVVFGVDIGRPLYTLGVMGWLGIVTLPSGGIALILYTVFVVAESMIARRKRRPSSHMEKTVDEGPPNLRSH